LGEWLKTRKDVLDELSDRYPMFCVCGKLCTGLHENNCKKFQDKITSETVKKLEYLLKSNLPE
jgi:hypothetical protein